MQRRVMAAETAEKKPAEKKEKKEPEPFTPPQLDPNTPSPIFGGSTGGLLRKAQVRIAGQYALSLQPPCTPNPGHTR